MKNSAGGFTAVLAAFAAVLVLKAFFFDFMLVEGSSMSPALEAGDVVVVFRLAYGLRFPFVSGGSQNRYLVRWKTPKEGELLVFWTPLDELAVKRAGRIVATRNGAGLIMLGDNSNDSFDSRSYGPVNPDNVIGKVLFKK
jgi:signal peptidase I